MTPSETAFTRTPREAYSIASERVTATRPPLVSAASADGRVLSAWSTRLVEMFTTCPPPWSTICRDRQLGDVEEPGEVHGRDRGVVIERVLRERFADVDTGVVDQRVDPPEPIASLLDGASCGFRICDVASDRDVIGLVGSADGNERATPTTAYPALRYPATSPAPMPWEAPVMIATGG